MGSSSSRGRRKTPSAARSHSVPGRSSSWPPCGAAGRQRPLFICALYAGRDTPSCLCAAIWLPECFLGSRKCKHTQTRGRGREMESFAMFLPSPPLLIGRGREVVYGLLQASSALLTLVRRKNKAGILASLQPCFVPVSLRFSPRVMATPLNPSDNWSRLSRDLSLFARPQR